MIEKHSLTWQHVIDFVARERQTAVDMLIADKNSERQRGAITVLERLLAEADDPDEKVIEDDYT